MDKVFFTGIGGSGMSKLALLYKALGFDVSGSDIRYSKNIELLENHGIKVFIGQKKIHIDDSIKKLIYSSAVKESNEELIEAQKLGIPMQRRGEALAEIVNQYNAIVVSGTHGKTTTTSIVGHILKRLGQDVNVYVGGNDDEFNAFSRDAKYFVVESDESDGSFLLLNPHILVITNIDKDHLNHYQWNFENLKNAFKKLALKSKLCVVSGDDPNAISISSDIPCKNFSIADKSADLYAENIRYLHKGVSFQVGNHHEILEAFLPMLGNKNVADALAALLAVSSLGFNLKDSIDALKSFSPPKRRMEFKGEKNGVIFIDDHADHPTEVFATLSALKKHFPEKRIIAVFQPHRYSRVKLLGKTIAAPFKIADITIVMDIYPAFEKPIPGIDGRTVFSWIKDENLDKSVFFAPDKENVLFFLKKILKKGDLVVLLGPGDIEEIFPYLFRGL